MAEDGKKLKLLDLIDIDFLQKFQDGFSEVMGISSLTYGEDQPLTKPSNFVEICDKFIRSSEKGKKRCQRCDLKWAELAAEQNKPLVYKCHVGLTDFVVPIIVGGQHVGSIFGGQVLIEKPDEVFFRKKAKELGINEEEFIEALNKVKIIPLEKLEAAVKFLSIVANSISEIALNNIKLRKVNKRENFYKNIVETIRNSLDFKETKQNIVNIIGRMMNADRCLIVEYNQNSDKTAIIRDEYLSSNDIMSYVGLDINQIAPDFVTLLKRGESIIVNNKEISNNDEKVNFNKEMATFKKYDALSFFAFPLYYGGELIGGLSISYINEKHEITDDEIVLLNMIADQIAIAIHQSRLYEITLEQAERETLLRVLTQSIRTSLDVNEIKKKTINLVGKALEADRCFFMDYDPKTDKFLKVKEEYLSSEDIPQYVGRDVNVDVPNFTEEFKKGSFLIIDSKEIFINGDYKDFEIEKITIDKLKIKSAYGVPLFYDGKLKGVLGLHYIRNTHSTNENETELLKMIVNQISIALNQAELYKTTKIQAKRDSVLRKITEKIRSSLDVEETLYFICEETARLFNVQRAVVSSFINESSYEEFLIRKEYKLSPDIIGLDAFSDLKKISDFWGNSLINSDDVLAFENIEESETPEFFKSAYLKIGVKSIIGSLIKKDNNIWGMLVLSEYNSHRVWTDEEKELLKTVATQIYIAINQAELFDKQKRAIEKEKLIGTIFAKALGVSEMSGLKSIVNEIGVMMKADRCYFAEVDLEKFGGKPIYKDSEYLSSPDIKSIIGYDFPSIETKQFLELYINKKDLLVFDFEKIREENREEDLSTNKYSKRFDLKSGIGIPFFYMNKFVAVLCVEYVKEKFLPSDEELDFFRILGNQIGLAFAQIRNYQNLKQTAERETALRTVIEAVRSSLDIDEVKINIVNALGKIFKADRCYFRTYDWDNEKVLPPDAEYLASHEIKSLKNVEPDQKALSYFIDLVKKENRGFYPIVVTEETVKGTDLENYIKFVDIKADYAIPIVDRDDELIWLVLHYAKEDPKLSEDSKKLLETIAYQIDIAFEQIRLYNMAQEKAKRENLLRNIFEAMRSSLDLNVIKKMIVTEVGKALDVDICFIMLYNEENDSFSVDEYSEYRSSEAQKSFVNFDANISGVKWFVDLFKTNKELIFANVDNFIQENNLQNTEEAAFIKSETYRLKSSYNISIYYGDKMLGYLILEYTRDYKNLHKEDIESLRIIATQAGVAIHQAGLFKITQIQAEREKISKNIIEILRSSLDKNIIKHLFVKNIGKYFKADIVFFSDYDAKQGRYLPVAENSEYRSSSSVKSFVGYDLSGDNTREYIQPLLEKRELNIYCLDDCIQNHSKSQEFISLFESFNIKSSYNLPVLYQGQIIGFFSIAFTQASCNKLQDEDINRIRSMCTQAGIALYHADLYVQAQESSRIKGAFITETLNESDYSLRNIIELSDVLSTPDLEQEKQIECINKINQIGKVILAKVVECKNYLDNL